MERVPDKRPKFSTVDEDGGILFVEEGKTLADYQNATPKDMMGIIAAVCSCMEDSDPAVALAAWDVPVVKRVAIFAEYHQFVESLVTAIEKWISKDSTQPVASREMLCTILKGLGSHAVLETLARAESGMRVSPTPDGWKIVKEARDIYDPYAVVQDRDPCSLEVNEWLMWTMAGLMLGRVEDDDVQVAACHLSRDMGTASYLLLYSQLPVKSILTKAKGKEERVEMLSTAVAKATSSAEGSIQALTTINKSIDMLHNILRYVQERLNTIAENSARAKYGEVVSIQYFFSFLLSTVTQLVGGLEKEGVKGKGKAVKGGQQEKGQQSPRKFWS